MLSSATMADQVVLKPPEQGDALMPVQQPWQIKWFSNISFFSRAERLFSNHGRSGGSKNAPLVHVFVRCSATVADRVVLKRLRSGHRRHLRSVTMADQVVLKPPEQGDALMPVQQPWQIKWFSNTPSRYSADVTVQQPWQIKWFSNLWVWICRLIWAFLFQRTAKSARSSCFCDPPGRFFDRAIGSPQASIPALTAVWIHYSKRLCQVAISAER